MPTTSNIIAVAKVSQYLASSRNDTASLYGGKSIDEKLPFLLYRVRKSLEWAYDLDPNYSALTEVGNYLYGLCGMYALQAQIIIDSGGGGVVINPSTGQPANLSEVRIQFEVGDPDELIADGETVMTIPYENIVDASVQIFLDGAGEIPINRSDRFSYTIVYSSTEAVVTFNEPVQDGQLFIVRALQTIS